MGSSTSTLSLRILLISGLVLTTASFLNLYLPTILAFIANDIPFIWSVIISWLRPPYLYVVINAIILTIAASSRLHNHYNHSHDQPLDHHHPAPVLEPVPVPVFTYSPVVYEPENIVHEEIVPQAVHMEPVAPVVFEPENMVHEEIIVPQVVDVEPVHVDEPKVVANEFEDKYEVSGSKLNTPKRVMISSPAETIQSEFVFPIREKPLVSSRFANQRRLSAKVNPEGARSLRVSKPKKHETLESTWKTITDGRHIPLNRHLKKSDTFENNHATSSDVHSVEKLPDSAIVDYNVMNKSETFHERTDRIKTSLPPAGGKLRKEGSLSHDDLNRRVEAFIKKFNDEMKLQRQESLKRYMEMINRGAE